MIKANELRIGNWLQFDNMIQPSRRIKVNARFFSSLASGKAEQELKDDEPINEYYQPILLTPEILEKAGFKWETENKRHLQKEISGDKRMTFYFDNGEMNSLQLYEEGYFDGFFSMDTVKYLHQLQNLYFSLTGEELPVNFKDLTYQ